QRPKEEIEVAGRRFVLQAMAGGQLEHYVAWQARVAERVVSELRELPDARMSDAAREFSRSEAAEFAWLLGQEMDGIPGPGRPADDQPAPTADWVHEQLSPPERQWILGVQEELLGADHVLGKAQALLLMAKAQASNG